MNSEVSQNILRTLARDERVTRLQAALGADAELVLVGGTVRDALRGKTPKDLDFAVRLAPDEVSKRLAAAKIQVIPTGLKHQTVTAVPVEGQPEVEITSFRGAQMSPTSGYVAGKSLEEDLSFRDFTVNALAYKIQSGEVVDLFGGEKDLESRVIRAVGNPAERFEEDPLRVMRMIRFAAALEFEIDPATFTAAKNFSKELTGVSVERIREEFSKILTSPRAADGMRQLAEIGALQIFLPELANCIGVAQNRFHTADVFEHTLHVVERVGPDLVLRLSALFHDVAKPLTIGVNDKTGDRTFYFHESVGAKMTAEILERLRYPNKVIEAVQKMVATHMRPIEVGAGGMRRLLRDIEDLYPAWRELKEADTLACKVDVADTHARLKRFDDLMAEVQAGPPVSPLKNLAVNGNDLIEFGIPKGPRIGEILRELHEKVLDEPELNTKEKLLALISN